MPPPSLRVDALEQQWRSLVNFGPRVHGTASGEAAATFVERELSAAGLVVQRQPFLAPGWQANGVASLELLAPERRGVAAHSMLLGAGTPGGGAVEGVIVDVGWLNLWGGQHAWRRLALVGHDGCPVAYICGRLNGSAVPQLLPSGSASVPHVAIGADDTRRLDSWIAEGRTIHMRLASPATCAPEVEAHNVHAVVPGAAHGGRRVVLVAHYDSVWTTAGAYDNASGTATVLEVARRLSRDPTACTVDVLLTGGEELGLLGAAAFVDRLRSTGTLEDIDHVINVEGLGRGDVLDVWAGPERFEWDVLSAVRRFDPAPAIRLRSTFPPLPGSDHAPFYAAGVPVAMITFDDQEILHSDSDVPNDEVLRNMRLAADLVEHLLRTLQTAVGA